MADKIEDLDLISLIDQRLPLSNSAKTTIGERVAAMILNALGFIDSRLYVFPEFLSKRPGLAYLASLCRLNGLMTTL